MPPSVSPEKTKPATVSLGNALGHEPSDKRVEILRLVGESGSISAAARQAGISYKAAWQAIDTLSNLAGVGLVERAVGGAGGGGARLTMAGQQLLQAAHHLAQSRRELLVHLQKNKSMLALPLPNMGIRTSMRNQLPCQVEQLVVKGQLVRVNLALSGGALLASRITKASAELLGLHKGQRVLALCKATAVQVCPVARVSLAADLQTLPGQAVRVSRGAAGDEVSLLLDAGAQLVGFARAGSGLRAKARVVAQMDEAAVVIALP